MADVLKDVVRPLGIVRIVPESAPEKNAFSPTEMPTIPLRIYTAGKTEILWGPPGTADVDKKNLLVEYAEQYGTLDAIPKNQQPVRLE